MSAAWPIWGAICGVAIVLIRVVYELDRIATALEALKP